MWPAPAGPAALPDLLLEGALSVGGVTAGLAGQLEQVAPFGAGNREPRFALTDARVATRARSASGHLSCILAGRRRPPRAIAFRAAAPPLARRSWAATPARCALPAAQLDRWRGHEEPCFQIEDAAPSRSPP